MENRLLTQERLDRMIDARDPAEAAKVLAECGYGELAELTGDGLEELLNQAQDQLARDLSSYPQAAAILPVFQCATDYHNAKVLVKGEALGWDGERMGRLLMPGGRWSSGEIAGRLSEERPGRLHGDLSTGSEPGPGRCWPPPATLSRRILCWTGLVMRN